MIKLKINSTSFTIPTTASEISLKQFIALRAWALNTDSEEYDLVSAFTGMDIDDAIDSAHIWQGRIDIADMVKLFSIEQSDKAIEVAGVTLKPVKFELLKVSQRMLMQPIYTALADGKELEQYLPRILAIGYGKQLHGKAWASNLSLSEQLFEEASAMDVLPSAYFFLHSSLILKKDGRLSSFRLMKFGLMQVANRWRGLVFGR